MVDIQETDDFLTAYRELLQRVATYYQEMQREYTNIINRLPVTRPTAQPPDHRYFDLIERPNFLVLRIGDIIDVYVNDTKLYTTKVINVVNEGQEVLLLPIGSDPTNATWYEIGINGWEMIIPGERRDIVPVRLAFASTIN